MSAPFSADEPRSVERFLADRGWLPQGARVVDMERAGDGNMNLTLRVRWHTSGAARGTAILKHARPWVEKYPDIPAPAHRVIVEADFYRLVAADPLLAGGMPAFHAVDEGACAALLEDLGDAGDYTGIYAGAPLAAGDLDALLAWLGRLHALDVDREAWPRLANRELRAMNHAHQFTVPLGDAPDGNGAPDADAFCPGLARKAALVRADDRVRRRLRELGALYLADGERLLHGDFHPGSWLKSAAGPRVIDPEFAFFGPPEYDLGVLVAHLKFAGDDGRSLGAYGGPGALDTSLRDAFTGMELIRRLIGIAQLPLPAGLAARERWLDEGVALLTD